MIYNTAVLSAYLPDVSYVLETSEAAVDDLAGVCRAARAAGAAALVVAGDLQTELPAMIDGITGPAAVVPPPGLPRPSQQTSQFLPRV